MRYTINFEEIRSDYKFNDEKKSLQHNAGKKISILPYTTQYKAVFKTKVINFSSCIGEFSRRLTNKLEYKKDINVELIKNVMNKVKMEEENKSVFKGMMKGLFFDKYNSIEIFHPKVLNYVTIEDITNKKLGQFLFDVLVNKDEEALTKIKSAYIDEPENILLKLIVRCLPELGEINTDNKTTYRNLMPFISNLFMEDLKYMLDKPKFYTENIEKLLKYYYFFYVSQLSINLNRMFEADISKPVVIYFNLDWENTSKSRISYNSGWKVIENTVITMFSHANCLELLNHSDCEENFAYLELKEIIDTMDSEELKEFNSNVDTLREIYKAHVDDVDFTLYNIAKRYENNEAYQNIFELYRLINYQFINSGRKGRQLDYGTWFTEFCKVNFLRRRGQLGYTLNFTEDNLIFITNLCIKNKGRLKLKDLFKEYERRGIFFDRDSQNKVVQLFEKLNILEKKSDSGDAQYVKSIL